MMEFGLREPIKIDEKGYILDGHHRLKLCKELGIEPLTKVEICKSEEQKIRLINQLNWARRHCNQWELYVAVETKRPEIEARVRAEQQLKYQKGKKGTQAIGVKSLTPIASSCNIGSNNNLGDGIDDNKKTEGRVNSVIGRLADISSTTVWQWKQVLDNATNEQSKALADGRTSPHKVYEKIRAAKKQFEVTQMVVVISGILLSLLKYQTVLFR